MMNLISNVVFATVFMLRWANMKNILILPQHQPPPLPAPCPVSANRYCLTDHLRAVLWFSKFVFL